MSNISDLIPENMDFFNACLREYNFKAVYTTYGNTDSFVQNTQTNDRQACFCVILFPQILKYVGWSSGKFSKYSKSYPTEFILCHQKKSVRYAQYFSNSKSNLFELT